MDVVDACPLNHDVMEVLADDMKKLTMESPEFRLAEAFQHTVDPPGTEAVSHGGTGPTEKDPESKREVQSTNVPLTQPEPVEQDAQDPQVKMPSPPLVDEVQSTDVPLPQPEPVEQDDPQVKMPSPPLVDEFQSPDVPLPQPEPVDQDAQDPQVKMPSPPFKAEAAAVDLPPADCGAEALQSTNITYILQDAYLCAYVVECVCISVSIVSMFWDNSCRLLPSRS